MVRSGSDHGSQDKAVFDINRCVFFKAVVRYSVLDHPVRFDDFGELKGSCPVTNSY